MIINTNDAINFAKNFITKWEINNEDVKQEMYLYMLEAVGKHFDYNVFYNGLKKICKKYEYVYENEIPSGNSLDFLNITYFIDIDTICDKISAISNLNQLSEQEQILIKLSILGNQPVSVSAKKIGLRRDRAIKMLFEAISKIRHHLY